jgi:hypothetical protein
MLNTTICENKTININNDELDYDLYEEMTNDNNNNDIDNNNDNDEDIEIQMIEKPKSKKDECIELKNIKYKTMLLKGVQIQETKEFGDFNRLEQYLENEKNHNQMEPWCKLDKTLKIKKFIDFIEIYKIENELDEEEIKILLTFLKDCLDRKKLQRVKDVIYDKTTGLIKDIPALIYTKSNKHFTLKNIDKKVSNMKTLKEKDKKNQGTIRNKVTIKKDNEK